jgi:hypothetical protein
MSCGLILALSFSSVDGMLEDKSMCDGVTKVVVVVTVALVNGATGYAAPRPAEKEGEPEKAIKIAVAKFVAAMSEQNVDAFVEACGVPFSHKPGKLVPDAATLRKLYQVEVEGRPPYDTHEVKRIETFKDAKARLGAGGVKGVDDVLRDEDFVATVELQSRGRSYEPLLLIKLADGKPTVVGWRPSKGK